MTKFSAKYWFRNEILNNLRKVIYSGNRKNGVFYFIDNNCYFEYRTKSKKLFVNYFKCWNILRTNYNYSNDKIRNLIKSEFKSFIGEKVEPHAFYRRFQIKNIERDFKKSIENK